MKAKVYRPELITNFTPVLRPKPSPPLDDLRLFDVLCLTFPAPLMPYLLGVMDIYRWQDRIDGTPEQKAAFTELWNHYQALFAEAEICGDDMPYRLRQSPSNPCVLQQSLDGGLNWSDAFDFSACLSPALRPLIVQAQSQALATAQASLTNIMQTYTSSGGGGQPTIDQVAPQFVLKGQSAKDLALCEACRVVVDMVCELELERRAQTVWGAQAFAAVVFAVGAGVLTAATVGLAAAPMMMAGAALLGVMADVGIGAIGTISDALLNDSEARQNVACCMYNALKGQSPTLANFSASLGGCGFVGGSNESQLAGAIAPLLAEEQVHAAFLNSLNELVRWAELGLISCPCETNYNTLTLRGTRYRINGGAWLDIPIYSVYGTPVDIGAQSYPFNLELEDTNSGGYIVLGRCGDPAAPLIEATISASPYLRYLDTCFYDNQAAGIVTTGRRFDRNFLAGSNSAVYTIHGITWP